jgi:protein SCO1/2
MKKNKTAFLLVLTALLVFPISFFLYFDYQHKHRPTLETDRCLPIYGPKIPFKSVDYKGRDFVDTTYFKVPAFSFINQNGDTITEAVMNDKVVVVDYFFTTCKTICVDMTRNLKRVQDKFESEDHRDVLILSHTVDPETDSVKQLFNYMLEKDINTKIWHLLTGDKKALYNQARNGYFITALQGDGGPNDFIHTEKLILIDKEHRIRGYYDGTNDKSVDKMIDDIKMLLVSYIVPMKKDNPKYKKKKIEE